jgi:hypothetical protein
MVVAVAMVLALGAAGCGGGSSDGSGGGSGEGSSGEVTENSSLTKSEFIDKAAEICQKGETRVFKKLSAYEEKLAAEHPKWGPTRIRLEQSKAVTLPELETELDEIAALGAPTGDQAQIEAILDSAQQAVDTAESRGISFEETQPLLALASKLGHQYGLEGCGLFLS